MGTNYWLFLLLLANFLTIESYGDSVWTENFDIPNKGIWGDEDGVSTHTDMEGIKQWSLETSECSFTAGNDYVKTVSTSGGRFEALDCDGEAIWRSQWISIRNLRNVSCQLTASETGSGATATSKYIHAYFRVDNQPEQLFETNGQNSGNWGEAVASQTGLSGDSLQIVVRLNSCYASDKVIVDQVMVQADTPPIDPLNLAAIGDILISEVLFNPQPYGSDFVELYNSSQKTIRLDHLFTASKSDEGEILSVSPITSTESYLLPGSYLLLSEDTANILLHYPTACTDNFLQVEQLPAMSDAEGLILLVNDSSEIIDEMNYSSTMHHPFLADEEGVSLERLSFSEAGTNPGNWISAAASAGYATPGCPNSNTTTELSESEEIILQPGIFSPNHDGYNDLLNISYSFTRPDFMASVTIFNSRGNVINKLIKQETSGQKGTWNWSGQQDDGSQAHPGIYVIYIELTTPQGNVKRIRKSCTLTDRLL